MRFGISGISTIIKILFITFQFQIYLIYVFYQFYQFKNLHCSKANFVQVWKCFEKTKSITNPVGICDLLQFNKKFSMKFVIFANFFPKISKFSFFLICNFAKLIIQEKSN